jgi:hypothetical protein
VGTIDFGSTRDQAKDGEAGTTVADRSTAAVGVANEGGATSDGTTTDDQTSTPSDSAAAEATPPARPAATPAPDTDTDEPGESEATQPIEPGDAFADTATDTLTAVGTKAGKPGGKTAEKPTAQPAQDPAETPATKPAAARTAPETAPETAAEQAEKSVDKTVEKPADKSAEKNSETTVRLSGAENGAAAAAATTPVRRRPKPPVTAPELHSGHKLARRYQLEECVTRVEGFSSWRAVDEKLRRAVGIHLLPADHERSRQVLAAARSAALLGDPRFVQVLDAVEEDELAYVIHEWLPDATSLADLLAVGPLEPHEAYQMVSQVSQGMSAAHREGLAHLRLDPGDVLRTVSGQYRIRGLAVSAALRGLSSERPQRKDTESIGALLYAALTQRWPYEEDAHGLAGLPKGVGLVAPDQVRAGVHRGLSELAMRALVNDGATASREEPPCTTPEELAKAVAAMPRIRPPENPPPVYRPAAFQPPVPPKGGAARPAVAAPVPPPALPGRTGQALKWAVAALVIVAIGLGSWQLADALKSRGNHPTRSSTSTGRHGGTKPSHKPTGGPLAISTAKDFDPQGDDGTENPRDVPNAYDGDASTYWQTNYYFSADLGGLKKGVGVVVDLGGAKNVSRVTVDFKGTTDVQLLAAAPGASSSPTSLDAFTKVADGSGTDVALTPRTTVKTRYLLVWLTKLPLISEGNYRGRITEIHVTG